MRESKGVLTRSTLAVLLFSFLYLQLSFSCSSAYRNIKIQLQATTDCNKGNPIIIRIHQLQSDATFKTITIESYIRNPDEAFGKDQLEKPLEKTVYPDSVLKLDDLKISKEAHFIAVVADFYEFEGDQWRLLEPAATFGKRPIIIACQGKRIVLLKQ